MKNPNGPIWNRTHDLPACNVVPQPTVPCTPLNIYSMEGKGREMMSVRRYMERGKECVYRKRRIKQSEGARKEKERQEAKMGSGEKGHYAKIKIKAHPRTGNEGPEGKQMYISTLSLTLALGGGGWLTPHPSHFTPGKDPVPIAQEARWAPGPVWMGAENLTPTRILSRDYPACSESLYRLCDPGPHQNKNSQEKLYTFCHDP